MRVRHFFSFFLIILLAGGGAESITAQSTEPFGAVVVEGGLFAQVNRTPLHEYWASSPGFTVGVAMPFYWGQVRGTIQQTVYESRADDLTDFRGRHVFLEWSMPVQLLGGLYAEGGGRLGVFQMHFDDEAHAQARHEQEVAAGLVAGLTYRTPWRWAVHVRASHVTVRLVRPLTLTLVRAGVSYTFGTPDWLQEALR